DYDFDVAELRRFVWDVGTSVAWNRFSVDVGVGGPKFDEGIQWTPSTARAVSGMSGPLVDETITAQENNRLAPNFLDFLVGVKVRRSNSSVLSGAVNVPVNDEGLRPIAVGTVGFEYYF